MQSVYDMFAGMARLFQITVPPLYRYPYRNSAEGLRGDMNRLGADIAYVFEPNDDEEES